MNHHGLATQTSYLTLAATKRTTLQTSSDAIRLHFRLDFNFEATIPLSLRFYFEATRTLALGTHREFDTIAADAEANGTPKHALAQLADVLQKCVACHASYQIDGATGQ